MQAAISANTESGELDAATANQDVGVQSTVTNEPTVVDSSAGSGFTLGIVIACCVGAVALGVVAGAVVMKKAGRSSTTTTLPMHNQHHQRHGGYKRGDNSQQWSTAPVLLGAPMGVEVVKVQHTKSRRTRGRQSTGSAASSVSSSSGSEAAGERGMQRSPSAWEVTAAPSKQHRHGGASASSSASAGGMKTTASQRSMLYRNTSKGPAGFGGRGAAAPAEVIGAITPRP